MDPLSNIILLTDSYKVSHYKQYPPGTERVLASRAAAAAQGGVLLRPPVLHQRSSAPCDAGESTRRARLRASRPRANRPRGPARARLRAPSRASSPSPARPRARPLPPRARRAGAELYAVHSAGRGPRRLAPNPGAFNREGWEHILTHGGKLPVSIKAVAEAGRAREERAHDDREHRPQVLLADQLPETLLVQVWYPKPTANTTNTTHANTTNTITTRTLPRRCGTR